MWTGGEVKAGVYAARPELQGSRYFVAAGDWFLWEVDGPLDYGDYDLHRENHATGTIETLVSGQATNGPSDIAESGRAAIAYRDSSTAHLVKVVEPSGVVTSTTVARWRPTLAGDNLIWRSSSTPRSTIYLKTPAAANLTLDGDQQIGLVPPAGAYRGAPSGWVVWCDEASVGGKPRFAVWTRSPAGLLTQVTAQMAARYSIDAINDDGEVVYRGASRQLVLPADPMNPQPILPAAGGETCGGTVLWYGGEWHCRSGSSVLKLDRNAVVVPPVPDAGIDAGPDASVDAGIEAGADGDASIGSDGGPSATEDDAGAAADASGTPAVDASTDAGGDGGDGTGGGPSEPPPSCTTSGALPGGGFGIGAALAGLAVARIVRRRRSAARLEG